MTAAAQETSSPDYRIYIGIENKDKEESLVQVGVAWKHATGNGLNAKMYNGDRYVLFPSKVEKDKPVAENAPTYRAFYEKAQKDGEKENVYIGAAWQHQKGNGLNLVMESGGRYTFFPYTKS